MLSTMIELGRCDEVVIALVIELDHMIDSHETVATDPLETMGRLTPPRGGRPAPQRYGEGGPGPVQSVQGRSHQELRGFGCCGWWW